MLKMEEELSKLEQNRLEKLHHMQAARIDPYPPRSAVTHTSAEAIKAFEASEAAAKDSAVPPTSIEATLAGRLRAIRPMGKLIFAHIEDRSGRIQLFFRVNDLGPDQMDFFTREFDLGDFIQATGTLFRTRTGEITLHVHAFNMLAKSLIPLPAAKDEVIDGKIVRHAVLTDAETRYRQRYADLAANPEVRQIFRERAAVIKALRQFLDDQDFLEVETPILQPIYGGAAARPFVTFHNQLKQELYLRISFELYLKRLLVGGLDRVYEIGRDFRNEGVSFKHNPEFTQLEFYMAYTDYHGIMVMTQNMIAYVADKVYGRRKFMFNGHEINMNPPWRRVDLRQGLIDATGIDINLYPTGEGLAEAMHKKGIPSKPGAARGKLIDGLLGDFLEPTLIQPTFLYAYPRNTSPLAKSKTGDPTTVERFEGFVGGMELCLSLIHISEPTRL